MRLERHGAMCLCELADHCGAHCTPAQHTEGTDLSMHKKPALSSAAQGGGRQETAASLVACGDQGYLNDRMFRTASAGQV